MVQNFCVVKILILTLVLWLTNGFNLSPRPNQSFREPKSNISMAQVQSSYFGFTINLRGPSVIVGAPRAQSTLKQQLNINETGAIYNCTISNGNCAPLLFENDNYILSQVEKGQQWLGGSMDGGSQDTDKLVVCAPRLAAKSKKNFLMHGICYWRENTLSNHPSDSKEINPFQLITNEFITVRNKSRVYMHGELGLSVHVTSNNAEIIIGVPGINNWRGSVIRFRKNEKNNYTAEVVGPDSYFGYSVGSGYFDRALPSKIYYVASAPQANHQHGEVYIFDIIQTSSGENDSIKKFHVFRGLQFGEYFGYAVLAEDLNGDGLADLIITAPQYSSDEIVEQGAIYVFINKGRFIFELQKLIKSPVEGKGRFGSSISKLGDINHDGYNDIAVGAPFAGNGTVFIYLGSSKGLREVSSQQLSAGPIASAWGPSPMFGHGLSKGADIDNNGFNDLAIGAPNAESVFVYRAYPVVKIHATINSLSRGIELDQRKFQIKICYRMSTDSQKVQSQDIAVRVNVDPQVKRVTLLKTNSAEWIFNATSVKDDICHLLDANVRFSMANIYKAIELEMHYGLINGVPNSEDFCDKCAAVDPMDPKASFDKITFTTGCKTEICIADLKVKSFGLSQTYTLGSSLTISVTYEVTNSGEKAYLPQIHITSSNKMPFNNIPPSCDQHGDVLLCDLNRGQSIFKNGKENITIVYDVSEIEGSSMNLTASVSCMGNEQDPSDNVANDFIVLQEFSEIEVNGKTNTTIDLQKVFNSTEIIYTYEIKSSDGGSKIQELEIAVEIPITHKFYESIQPVLVIDVNRITVQGVYNGQMLNVELYLNNTLLLLNSTEIETETIFGQYGNETIYQSSNINSVELENDSENLETRARKKRGSIEKVAPNKESIESTQKKLYELLSKEEMESLPSNRTIVFSCYDPEMVTCVRAVMKVNNFIANTLVNVTLQYHVDLNEVNKTLIHPLEFFVIIPKLDIVKLGDLDGNTINITSNMEYNVISKNNLYNNEIPWLVIILAILGGILILGAIAYGMRKAGFFKRTTKEEMERVLQQKVEAAKWREEMKNLFPKREAGENTEGDEIET